MLVFTADPVTRNCQLCGEPFEIAVPYTRQKVCSACRTKKDRHQDPDRRNSRKLRIIGIDGEGGGRDELGRQYYRLMCASWADGPVRDPLFLGNKPLTTEECFKFILSLPRDALIFGFGFGYDITQILRQSMPKDKLLRIAQLRQMPRHKARAKADMIVRTGQFVSQLCRNLPPNELETVLAKRVFDANEVCDFSLEDIDDDWPWLMNQLDETHIENAYTDWNGYRIKW